MDFAGSSKRDPFGNQNNPSNGSSKSIIIPLESVQKNFTERTLILTGNFDSYYSNETRDNRKWEQSSKAISVWLNLNGSSIYLIHYASNYIMKCNIYLSAKVRSAMKWWSKYVSMTINKTAGRNVAFKASRMSESVLES